MLGARIRLLRENKGWSQSDLAQRLNISASAIGMYEQGRREPCIDILVRLSQTFDVSLDFLVLGNAQLDAQISVNCPFCRQTTKS